MWVGLLLVEKGDNMISMSFFLQMPMLDLTIPHMGLLQCCLIHLYAVTCTHMPTLISKG